MTGENSLLERMVDGKLGPGSDIGPADSQIEGTYRRGYHQAMAEVAYYLKNGGTLSAASLNDWVSEDLRRWRQGRITPRFIARYFLLQFLAADSR